MVEQTMELLKVKLADWAESWLLNLRQHYRADSRPLTDKEVSGLRGFFGANLLANIRVAAVDRIPNPPFFASLPRLGLPVPWDFSADTGLSVVDTVMLSEPLITEDKRASVLFHQCVHVQQFQILGVSKLVARYVHGLFANSFNFRDLPLERQAENLQFRFNTGGTVFSVEYEVEQALLKGAI